MAEKDGFTELKPNRFEYYNGEPDRRVFFFSAREKKLFEGGTPRLQSDMLRRKKEEGEYRDATA